MTRATMTLLGAAAAGLLIWIATKVFDRDLSTGEFWTIMLLLAAAGLVMALSQLFGGWTKWGVPRVSPSVFLLAFIPVLIVAGWIIVAGEPGNGWLARHVRDWSDDIGVEGFVNDMQTFVPVLAFGVGLVFGFVFDTSGPRTEPVIRRRREVRETPAGDADDDRVRAHPLAADTERDRGARTAERVEEERATPAAPQPPPEREPPP